jgi:hypothetical protein
LFCALLAYAMFSYFLFQFFVFMMCGGSRMKREQKKEHFDIFIMKPVRILEIFETHCNWRVKVKAIKTSIFHLMIHALSFLCYFYVFLFTERRGKSMLWFLSNLSLMNKIRIFVFFKAESIYFLLWNARAETHFWTMKKFKTKNQVLRHFQINRRHDNFWH